MWCSTDRHTLAERGNPFPAAVCLAPQSSPTRCATCRVVERRWGVVAVEWWRDWVGWGRMGSGGGTCDGGSGVALYRISRQNGAMPGCDESGGQRDALSLTTYHLSLSTYHLPLIDDHLPLNQFSLTAHHLSLVTYHSPLTWQASSSTTAEMAAASQRFGIHSKWSRWQRVHWSGQSRTSMKNSPPGPCSCRQVADHLATLTSHIDTLALRAAFSNGPLGREEG